MPEDISELDGDAVTLQLREENFEQRREDVYAVRWTGGGGFGDPLDRDPEDINADLENFAISEAAAENIYGAVIVDGRVDETETTARREAIRRERVERHNLPSTTRPGEIRYEVATCLNVQFDKDGDYWACAKCSTDLGPTDVAYKDGCIREDLPISSSNPLIGDPSRFIDDDVAFRQFYCPGCGALIENEVAITSDTILSDIMLDG